MTLYRWYYMCSSGTVFHWPSETEKQEVCFNNSWFYGVRTKKQIYFDLFIFRIQFPRALTIKLMDKYILCVAISLIFTSCSLNIGENRGSMDDNSLSWSDLRTWIVWSSHTGETHTGEKEEIVEHELTLSGNDNHSGSTLDTSLIEMDTLFEKN